MPTTHNRRGRRSDALAARLNTSTFTAMSRLKRGRPRGVTMIEYVLLAAIVVVLAVLLRKELYSMFEGILKDIQTALGTAAPTKP